MACGAFSQPRFRLSSSSVALTDLRGVVFVDLTVRGDDGGEIVETPARLNGERPVIHGDGERSRVTPDPAFDAERAGIEDGLRLVVDWLKEHP